MHANTASLLSYRDREPMPLVVRQHIEDCANCQSRLSEIQRRQLALRKLPDVAMPVALRDPASFGPVHQQLQPGWRLAITGIAASLLVATFVILLLQPGATPDTSPKPVLAAQTATSDVRVRQWQSQSSRLEQVLQSLPDRPAITRANNVSTEAAVTQQLRLLDAGLSEAGSSLTPEQQAQLWHGRVALLDSLAKLRYAQYRRTAF